MEPSQPWKEKNGVPISGKHQQSHFWHQMSRARSLKQSYDYLSDRCADRMGERWRLPEAETTSGLTIYEFIMKLFTKWWDDMMDDKKKI